MNGEGGDRDGHTESEQVERATYPAPEHGARHDERGERVPDTKPDRDRARDAEVLEEHRRHADDLETPPGPAPDGERGRNEGEPDGDAEDDERR